jgi:hypothetical protein
LPAGSYPVNKFGSLIAKLDHLRGMELLLL